MRLHLFHLSASLLAVQLVHTVHGILRGIQRHGKHCGAQRALFPFTPTDFLACSTCSLSTRAALTRWHLLSGQTYPAADVPSAAFSLPKVLHVQANKKFKSYICEQPTLGIFAFTNMSLHFDIRCLSLLFLQFFTLLKSLLKAGCSNSSVNCRKHYFVL